MIQTPGVLQVYDIVTPSKQCKTIALVKPQHPPGAPMTLGKCAKQGVHHLIAYCLNDACRHQTMIDVSRYPRDPPVPV
jgi:hypothetical protein